jgi:hypothetical protein
MLGVHCLIQGMNSGSHLARRCRSQDAQVHPGAEARVTGSGQDGSATRWIAQELSQPEQRLQVEGVANPFPIQGRQSDHAIGLN